MPFEIQISDILSFSGDAIINPTDASLSGSGGLDAQIHAAAGLRFRLECARLRGLATGEAVMTRGRRLPCRYVIHTSAPFWTGKADETEQLRNCYRSSLALAEKYGLEELAFPLIGSGTKGFPKELVLRVAAEEISAYLENHADTYILLVVHDKAVFQPEPELLSGLAHYIREIKRKEAQEKQAKPMLDMASTSIFPAITMEDILAERQKEHPAPEAKRPNAAPTSAPAPTNRPKTGGPTFSRRKRADPASRDEDAAFLPPVAATAPQEFPSPASFDPFDPDRSLILDESFSQMVMRKIDERGFKKDSECYNKANLDRKLFSRIRCDTHYHPKKTTALALAIALELSLDETNELLMKAGYSLSHSIVSDVIVEYCIIHRRYNIFEVNELLFQYDQALLGG